jgi:hypothetical protein
MLKDLIYSSTFISFSKIAWSVYLYVYGWLVDKYKYSQMHRFIRILREKLKIYFECSFFGKITSQEEESNAAILDNSEFIRQLVILYGTYKEKASAYSKTSTAAYLAKGAKKELYLLSVKGLSIIVVIAVLTNSSFCIMANQETGLLGWLVRALLLFFGISGIFCNTGWRGVMDNSITLRLIKK